MSGYITKSACRGRRPSQFSGYSGYQRQELITRMLKERSVARFVVAPSGYGKTCLAIDYAETVFSWIHTFFVSCKSPCFIRDLDEGTIAVSCRKADSDARLVIFDGVPVLDIDRARRFSNEIDKLISDGCEVIVTCLPAGDALGQLQHDQVRIGANDLLLSDEELDAARTTAEREQVPSSDLPASRRVPALVWESAPESALSFLKNSLKESMPTDVMLAMASMLVLQRGPIEGLAALGPIDASMLGYISTSYPHFGIDLDQGRFEAPAIDVEIVAKAVKPHLADLVKRSCLKSGDELAFAWADLLLDEEGGAERACDVVRAVCLRANRADWVCDRAYDLLRAGCFYPTLRLVRSMRIMESASLETKAISALLEAICCMMLGDANGAASHAARFAFSPDAPAEVSAYCLLILARTGSARQAERAETCLRDAVTRASGPIAPGIQPSEALVRAWQASREGAENLVRVWIECHDAGMLSEVLCVVASWLFDVIGGQRSNDGVLPFGVDGTQIAQVERYVRNRFEAGACRPLDFFTVSAALSMERAHVNGMGYSWGPVPTSVLLALRHAEMSVLCQRQRYEEKLARDKAKQSNWMSPLPESRMPGAGMDLVARAPRNVPILELKMFGRFEVTIGDVAVDPRLFRRQNVRSLLVLLAINQGRDVPREMIIDSMWPNSAPQVARKNYYSVWSQLKRALMLPDGTCPYLVRHQYGCSLQDRYVHSDVARLSQICRELLFGRPDSESWAAIYAELDSDFANDLLPSETNNPLVKSARDDYRKRLIDALVAATKRIVDAGDSLWGIWLARMAISREKTREDAYVALMRAQVASDQRTAAIMTFHECRKVLAEELGVDPSPEMVALYESLLD